LPTEEQPPTAKLLRWFICVNTDCKTNAITRVEDRRSYLPSERLERKLRLERLERERAQAGDRTSGHASPIAELSKGDDMVMDALGDLPPWEDAPVPAKHWHPVCHLTMRADGHLCMS
jgi:hypothetical protein